jgi:hypothetical protein
LKKIEESLAIAGFERLDEAVGDPADPGQRPGDLGSVVEKDVGPQVRIPGGDPCAVAPATGREAGDVCRRRRREGREGQ